MLHKKVLEIKTDDSILAATVQFLISLLGFDKLQFIIIFFKSTDVSSIFKVVSSNCKKHLSFYMFTVEKS